MSTTRAKVACASLSLIIYDFATNFNRFRKAIDLAAEDQADILATAELSGTGYEAEDYHQWNKDNTLVWTFLRAVARYAEEKNPNLVVTVGVPWHFADKTLPVMDPAYNITNKPFNVQAVITGGRVVAMSAKSVLANGPAEYEQRQFNDWPLSKGTIKITLPDGCAIPFGKPVVHLGDGRQRISLVNEICAEAWPGVSDDLTINAKEQDEGRYIVGLSQTHDLSVVLNPSASKPEPSLHKEHLRSESLCKTGSGYCGLYVYVNYLGSASGVLAGEGSQIYAQKGEIIHHGQRYAFTDVSYSSVVADVPLAVRGEPSVFVSHDFTHHELKAVGQEAAFDQAYAKGTIDAEQLSYEEYIGSTALWLHDYATKQEWSPQGYLINLSGGKDSAYGAIQVTSMIDRAVATYGLDGFFEKFKGLKSQGEVLEARQNLGEKEAIKLLKRRFLTFVYEPTDISSERTLKAARFLIEGGVLPNGQVVEGIGGTFRVAQVQPILEEILVSSVGLDLGKVAQTHAKEILGKKRHFFLSFVLSKDEITAVARSKALAMIRTYVNAPLHSDPQLPDYITRYCDNRIPTWANPADDLNLQNMQPRARTPISWTIASYEGKIPLTTSNQDEAIHSYMTAGGDMAMGGINPLGGVPKQTVISTLHYVETCGLAGSEPQSALYWINREKPSAELRKTVDGAAEQTDEADLNFTFAQSRFISQRLLMQRRTPLDVFAQMKESALFSGVRVARDTLMAFTKRWPSGHFKRIMAPSSPYVGGNVDPHQSIRTTVIGDHFKTGDALVTLASLVEISGGNEAFKRSFGLSPSQAQACAVLNQDFKQALVSWSLAELQDPEKWQGFAVSNRAVLTYVDMERGVGLKNGCPATWPSMTQ